MRRAVSVLDYRKSRLRLCLHKLVRVMTQSALCQIAVTALAASARLLVSGSEDMPLSPKQQRR
eukprot:188072-Prymnesium_polylepis.1